MQKACGVAQQPDDKKESVLPMTMPLSQFCEDNSTPQSPVVVKARMSVSRCPPAEAGAADLEQKVAKRRRASGESPPGTRRCYAFLSLLAFETKFIHSLRTRLRERGKVRRTVGKGGSGRLTRCGTLKRCSALKAAANVSQSKAFSQGDAVAVRSSRRRRLLPTGAGRPRFEVCSM